MSEERRFPQQLPLLPDCSAVGSYSPCARDLGRTMRFARCITLPPSESGGYAQAHDDHDVGIWETLRFFAVADWDCSPHSAQALRHTMAYWAAWADVLPMISARAPDFACRCLAALESLGGEVACLRETAAARDLLQQEGWHDCPAWSCPVQGTCPAPDHAWQMNPAHVQHLLSRTRDNACYTQTCRPVLRRFCGPRPGHRRALGSL